MATYTELFTLASDATLKQKVQVAMFVTALEIIAEDPKTVPFNEERRRWATRVLRDADTNSRDMLQAVLADNRAATVAQINAATDDAIKTSVGKMVNLFACNP